MESVVYEINKFIVESKESCWKHSIVASVAGGAMGIGLGTFLGTFEGAHGEIVGKNMKEQLYNGFRKSFVAGYNRSVYFSKQFALIGASFAFVECNIDQIRAKHDVYSTVLAGGTTGGMFGAWGSRSAGTSVILKSTMKGSLSFAAFTAVIEYFLHHYSN